MSIDNAIDNTNNAIVKPQSDNIYVFYRKCFSEHIRIKNVIWSCIQPSRCG